MSSTPRPRFTLVSAVYGVAAYLPEFIASIEAQDFPLDRVEVVMVDDGSTDGSLALLQDWQERRPELVTVITRPNGGQGAARNTGMEAAHGEWISFPDPDDVLDAGYLSSVDVFLTAHPETHLVATNRWLWDEGTGQVTNTHPLKAMFRRDRLVDLEDDGWAFHGSAPAAFFALDTLREQGTAFDLRVRPNFEDGHFTCCYLLGVDRPQVGFLPSARYHYRKRAAGGSTLNRSRQDPDRYTSALEHGHLDTVRRARARLGHVPTWLQQFLVYELSWYFSDTDSQLPLPEALVAQVGDRFHAVVREILDGIDPDVIAHPSVPVKRIVRMVLAHGYADTWREPTVLLDHLDDGRKLVRASWFYVGDEPRAELRSGDDVVEPLHTKTRTLDYLGRTLLRQRIVWLPSNRSIEVRLEGRPVELVFRRPYLAPYKAMPQLISWQLRAPSARAADASGAVLPTPTTREGRKAQQLMGRPRVRARYENAWVLMDRIHDAGDSGEILFRHLRDKLPKVNAWFVLEKGVADWKRLRAEGYGDRLVAHGSLQWRLLMAHAIHLVSSHADDAVTDPPAVKEFTNPGWKFTFLQHGVIKDDLSAWLNRKDIETFVTSSSQELASIAGDETPYLFTTREVKLTGLPRFDRLRAQGLRFPAEKRDLLLVAPTWRNHLVQGLDPGTQRRQFDRRILESDFVRQWHAFLVDPRLEEAARRHGVKVAFLPHPNLQEALPHLELPDHVMPLAYEGSDVQEFFARSRALVTDFSSVAFNAAYLERPVVYFQFDEDVVLGGGHVGRRGYFDYRRDGFGPVETGLGGAVEATVAALDHGPEPAPPYRERIEATFPLRDGRCCQRVVAAIRSSHRNQSGAAPVPTPVAPAPTGTREAAS